MPELETLDQKRIDVLYSVDIIVNGKKESVLRWCQGKVIEVYDQEERPRMVRVKWDPTPDIDGGEDSVETDQELKKHLWNKDKALAWRMDIDVEVGKEIETLEDSDEEIESESESEIESESSIDSVESDSD